MRKIALIAVLLLVAGCASVISKDVLREVDRNITITMVQADPGAYKGKKVIWGGTILKSENLEKVTEIEVLESELSFDDRPADGKSRGRFIIEAERFLDTEVYKPGKRITVAGVIKGIKVKKIGKMDYRYPVVTPIEMRLFEPPPKVSPYEAYYPPPTIYPYYPWPYPYYPYNPYYPYYPWPYPYP